MGSSTRFPLCCGIQCRDDGRVRSGPAGSVCVHICGAKVGRLHARSTRWRVGLMLIGAVLLGLSPVSCSVQSRLLEGRLQPVIVALEAYRGVNGSYPNALDALVPDHMESLPTCPNFGITYFTREEAGITRFLLTCVTFGFNKHTYFSATGLWKDWD